jgi:hypothetical protein
MNLKDKIGAMTFIEMTLGRRRVTQDRTFSKSKTDFVELNSPQCHSIECHLTECYCTAECPYAECNCDVILMKVILLIVIF